MNAELDHHNHEGPSFNIMGLIVGVILAGIAVVAVIHSYSNPWFWAFVVCYLIAARLCAMFLRAWNTENGKVKGWRLAFGCLLWPIVMVVIGAQS